MLGIVCVATFHAIHVGGWQFSAYGRTQMAVSPPQVIRETAADMKYFKMNWEEVCFGDAAHQSFPKSSLLLVYWPNTSQNTIHFKAWIHFNPTWFNLAASCSVQSECKLI